MNPISKQFSSIEQVTGQYLKQKNVTVKIDIIREPDIPIGYQIKKPTSYHKHCNSYYISLYDREKKKQNRTGG